MVGIRKKGQAQGRKRVLIRTPGGTMEKQLQPFRESFQIQIKNKHSPVVPLLHPDGLSCSRYVLSWERPFVRFYGPLCVGDRTSSSGTSDSIFHKKCLHMKHREMFINLQS